MRILAATVMLTTALAITSCSSSSDSATSPPSTSALTTTTAAAPSTSTTSTTATPTTSTTADPLPADDALFAAVDSFWDLYLELGASTDPFDPTITRESLEEHTTGTELEQLFNYFQSNSLAGYTIRGDIESSLSVVAKTETTAEVRDCYDDTTGLYRIERGERLDEDNPARHQVVLHLVLEDGSWKVESITDEGDGCTAS